MEEARSTNISVARAKKLLKELQAQAAAAAAALELRAACEQFSGDTAELQVGTCAAAVLYNLQSSFWHPGSVGSPNRRC